jgi:LDH2 family malate/lactate/ureidoglycolate dehydrogenase
VAEYQGIENEPRLAHAALHRVVRGIFERVGRLIRESRSTRLAPGVARVFVPGEMEAELERRQRTDGVPRNEVTVQGGRDAAVRLGVDASALR